MRIPMPVAVLAGGESRRMGVPKASLPWGASTLAAHQTERLGRRFEDVWLVVREAPAYEFGGARVLFDRDPERSAVSGLVRALEEATDRVFVVAVDLPLLTGAVIEKIGRRSRPSPAAARLPETREGLEPLAGVWRRAALEAAAARMAAGDRSLRALAAAVGAEAVPERAWRSPSIRRATPSRT